MVAAWFGVYLAAHFALYAAFLRHLRLTASERGIFLYHFVPAVSWVLVLATLAAWVPGIGIAHVALVAGLHGVYSLTFLELWALADGGYSLAILESLVPGNEAGLGSTLSELEQLGSAKQEVRLSDLLQMGLIERNADEYRLTPAGHLAGALIAAIARLSRTTVGD
jgi:hypothetical protein